jgi:hypothetical protein
MIRKLEVNPNGRKITKRMRRYKPVYGYNSYQADQPWDIFSEKLN